MFDMNLLIVPVIAFLAFVLKAMTGFGPAIVLVALGSLLMPPQVVVVMSSVLAAIAGVVMLRADPIQGARRFWIPMAIAMALGSVIGGLFVSAIVPDDFRLVLGITILILAVWFFVGRGKTCETELCEELPETGTALDCLVAAFGGFIGGFLGIGGPPLIWYLGRRFAKRAFRQALIPVFLASTSARFVTYLSSGLVDRQVAIYTLVAVPGLFLGIYFGNRVFLKVSETTFSRIVAVALALVAIKLVW